MKGETHIAEVSIGMTNDEQDQEDEATGWGGYRTEVGSGPALLFSLSPDVRVHCLSGTSFAAGECVFRRIYGEFLVLLVLILADRYLNR